MRLPFATARGTLADALNSQRSMNIDMNAAICELIDNSLEHGGKNVWANIDYKSEVGHESDIDKVIVVDDGYGMDPEKLANHLVIGFHDEESEGTDRKFGKFGVGAKYAFFNNCTKSQVWSKTPDGEWYKTEFDLEDEYLKLPVIKLFLEIAKSDTTGLNDEEIVDLINSQGFGYPKPSIRENPPAEHREMWGGLSQGTFVLWTNFDRGELPFGMDEIEWNLGKIYRKWIGEKIVETEIEHGELVSKVKNNPNRANIWFNGDPIKSYDPLYRIPFKEGDEIDEDYDRPPLILKYDLNDDLVQKYGKTQGLIKIQFGLAPKEWRKHIGVSAASEENMIERRIQGEGTSGNNKAYWDSRKISILRAGREVASIWDAHLIGTGRAEATDRWWGLEIDFEECLDEAFNVQNVKSRIVPVSDLKKKIKDAVSGTVAQMQREISDYFDEIQNEEVAAERRRVNEQRRLAKIACEAEGGTWSNNRCIMPGDEEEDDEEEDTTFTPDDEEPVINPDDAPDLEDDDEEETEETLRHIFGDNAFVETILQRFDNDERVVQVEDNFTKRVPQDTNMMFEYKVRGGKLLKVRYQNHPYHKELKHNYEVLENSLLDLQEHIDGGELDSETISNILNIMSKAFIEVETIRDYGINSALLGMGNIQRADDDRRRLMSDLVAKWSEINLNLVDRLTRNRE